jgi:hypothetical protein
MRAIWDLSAEGFSNRDRKRVEFVEELCAS